MFVKKLVITIIAITLFGIAFYVDTKTTTSPQPRDTNKDFIVQLGKNLSIKFLYLQPKTSESGYFLAASEVTIAQYQEVMSKQFLPSKCILSIPGELKPVNSMMAEEAITELTEMNLHEFIARLAEKSGVGIRLSTDIEWTYAAFCGMDRNYCKKYQPITFDPTTGTPLKKSNAWGFKGMFNGIEEVTLPEQKFFVDNNGLKHEIAYITMGKAPSKISGFITKFYMQGSLNSKFRDYMGVRLACNASHLQNKGSRRPTGQ